MNDARSFRTATGSSQRSIGGLTACSLLFICLAPILICGCSSAPLAGDAFREANHHFARGDYNASLNSYRQIIAKEPTVGDRALFEMGLIHTHPGNSQKDYQKAQDCFQQLVRDYPGSTYRKDSELMLFNITTVRTKDATITAQQAQIEAFRQELQDSAHTTAALQNRISALEQELRGKEDALNALKSEPVPPSKGPADRILIEKNARRLTLFAKGKTLKSYPVALGGNPNGPKQRQGDNKTPEGLYRIESRNRNSNFHLSLRISYPNEQDKKRAKELGVSPGGDIMIHGIKNGLAWVGNMHAEVDWTKGCIAVTDQEIEEIERLVPNGTTVEIRP